MPFNIGPGELILFLIIALVVLGPGSSLTSPQSLGKSVREFRKAATDISDAGKLDVPPASAEATRRRRRCRPRSHRLRRPAAPPAVAPATGRRWRTQARPEARPGRGLARARVEPGGRAATARAAHVPRPPRRRQNPMTVMDQAEAPGRRRCP